MSYDWFNRKEILQKAKERHSKEKAAKGKGNKRKVKESIQKPVRGRKRQD